MYWPPPPPLWDELWKHVTRRPAIWIMTKYLYFWVIDIAIPSGDSNLGPFRAFVSSYTVSWTARTPRPVHNNVFKFYFLWLSESHKQLKRKNHRKRKFSATTSSTRPWSIPNLTTWPEKLSRSRISISIKSDHQNSSIIFAESLRPNSIKKSTIKIWSNEFRRLWKRFSWNCRRISGMKNVDQLFGVTSWPSKTST